LRFLIPLRFLPCTYKTSSLTIYAELGFIGGVLFSIVAKAL
jgi:hypothetical protein